ncbi:unnamed protein product [Owenia fusiformis]|uniref:Uncharacterized protein n=1 Tax=Owenia fusiformis TaxID=6347 RepID=A0A8S4PBZ3_OWEFU|nr:unnamed protein product [Owenia fusiformis]
MAERWAVERRLLTYALLLGILGLGWGLELTGTDGSYAMYPKWNACINASIKFEFKTRQRDALIFYTDDGGRYDFFKLNLTNGALTLTLNIVDGHEGFVQLTLGSNLGDGVWHQVEILRHRMETILYLDGQEQKRLAFGSDFNFGKLETNSMVYFGGLPHSFWANIHSLADPASYLNDRFSGSIRNILYRNCSCDITRVSYLDGKNAVTVPKEACEERNPCKKGCLCVSKDEGPFCDCSELGCGKSELTHYSLPMDIIFMDTVINPSGLDAQVRGAPKQITPGIKHQAISLEGKKYQFVRVAGPGHRYECFGDLSKCPEGYTVSMWMKFKDPGYKEGVYMSNGGHTPTSHGIALLYGNGYIEYRFRKPDGTEWRARADNILHGHWYHLAATWSDRDGLKVYVDGKKVAEDNSPEVLEPGAINLQKNKEFFIGRPNDDSHTSYDLGTIDVDEFNFWSKQKTDREIREIGPFFCYNLPMDTIDRNRVDRTPTTAGYAANGRPKVVPAQMDGGIKFDGRNDYIDMGDVKDTCLGDLEQCVYGLTIAAWVQFPDLVDKMYIMDSGSKGFKIYYDNGNLYAEATSGIKSWRTSWDGIESNKWYYLEVSWENNFGLSIRVDFEEVASSGDFNIVDISSSDSNMYIGRANGAMRRERYAIMIMDNLRMCYGDIQRLSGFDHMLRGEPTKHYFDMEKRNGNQLMHSKYMINLIGEPRIIPGHISNALEFDSEAIQYASLGDHPNSCFGNLDLCPYGVLFATWIKPGEFQDDEQYFSTGRNGLTIEYKDNKVCGTFTTSTRKWVLCTDKVKEDQWQFLEYSWHPTRGLKLYKDNELIESTTGYQLHDNGGTFNYRPDLDQIYFGRSNKDINIYPTANATIDDTEFWYADREYLIAHGYITREKPIRYYFSMDEIRQQRLVHPSLNLPLSGTPFTVPGKMDNALRLNGYGQSVDVGEHPETCLGNLENSRHGMSVVMWLNFHSMQDNAYVFSTGHNGMKIFTKDGDLKSTVNQPGKQWDVSTRLDTNNWYYIEVSWHDKKGLKMYVDSTLVDSDRGRDVRDTAGRFFNNRAYIGRANTGDVDERFKYADIIIDEVEIFCAERDYLIAHGFIVRPPISHSMVSFEKRRGRQVLNPHLFIQLHNGAMLRKGHTGNALDLNGANQYADLGNLRSSCSGNLDLCRHGLMITFLTKPRTLEDGMVFLNGGSYSMYYMNGKTHVKFWTPQKTWTVSTDRIRPDEWSLVDLSWHPEKGLVMYVNEAEVARSNTFTSTSSRQKYDYTTYIGRSPDMTRGRYFNGMTDELEIWHANKDVLTSFGMLDRGVVDHEVFNMDGIQGDQLTDTGRRVVYVHGTPTVIEGVFDGAIKFDGVDDYVNLGQNLTCHGDLQRCIRGFTMNFRIKPFQLTNNMYVFSSDAINVYFQGGKLHGRFQTPNKVWSISKEIDVNKWSQVQFTWNKQDGAQMFIDGIQVDEATTSTPRETRVDRTTPFYIGRSSQGREGEKYLHGVIDDVQFWNAKRDILIALGLIYDELTTISPTTSSTLPTRVTDAVIVVPPNWPPRWPNDNKYYVFRDRVWVDIDTTRLPLKPDNVKERFELKFRTTTPDGLIWYTGNDEDNMHLNLKDGKLILNTQFDYNNNRGTFRSTLEGGTYADNDWHNVVIERDGTQITMYVDDRKHFTRNLGVDFNFINNDGNIYFAGSPNPRTITRNTIDRNFVGDIKEIVITGDDMNNNRISLPDIVNDPNPKSYVTRYGQIDEGYITTTPAPTTTTTPTPAPENPPVTILRNQDFIRLNRWDALKKGDISFKFRTTDPQGVLFFNGGSPGVSDFVAAELYDGKLYFLIDLGDGANRTLVSDIQVDDGRWHTFHVSRDERVVDLTLDRDRKRVNIQGSKVDLHLGTQFYLGGIQDRIKRPWQLWSKDGFVGCIDDLRINNQVTEVDLGSYARDQGMVHITTSCRTMPNPCERSPCANGRCINRWNQYECDCYGTQFYGPLCQNFGKINNFDGVNYIRYPFPDSRCVDVNDITLRFKTSRPDGSLFITEGDASPAYIKAALVDGSIVVSTNLGTRPLEWTLGRRAWNDNNWHTLGIRRRVNYMEAWVDSRRYLKSGYLDGQDFCLDIDTIYVASFPKDRLSTNWYGGMQNIYVNHHINVDPGTQPTIAPTSEPKPVIITNPVTFDTKPAHVTLRGIDLTRPEDTDIAFNFRTREPDGILFYQGSQTGTDFVVIELVDGKLFYRVNNGYGPISIEGKPVYRLDDNRWHYVRVTRPNARTHNLQVDETNNKGTIRQSNEPIDLTTSDTIFIGGLSSNMYNSLNREIISREGYKGCVASTFLNNQPRNLRTDAITKSGRIEDRCGDPLQPEIIRPVTFGTADSYVTVPGLDMTRSAETDISFSIKTDDRDGVILYNGGVGDNFFVVELVDGHVVYRFDNGDGPVSVRANTPAPINDNEWHHVRIYRPNELQHILIVDDNSGYVSAKNRNPIRLNGNLFIGGGSSRVISGLSSSVQSSSGITGCIASVDFNGRRPDIINDAIRKQGSVENGCRRVVVVLPTDTGPTDPTSTEAPSVVRAITFPSQESHLTLDGFDFNRQPRAEVSFMFKTMEPDGLIMYNGGPGADFVAVELVNGFLEYHFDEGNGAISKTIATAQTLDDNEWHFVSISRPNRNEHLVTLDGRSSRVQGKRGGNGFNLDKVVYLGGVPLAMYDDLSRSVTSVQGFKGCLGSVDVNGRKPDLIREATFKSADITDGCNDLFRPVSFKEQGAYLSLETQEFSQPQPGNVAIAFKTMEPDGLMIYNGPAPSGTNRSRRQSSEDGRRSRQSGSSSFMAVEMKGGYVYYSFHNGYAPITVPANTGRKLDDNKWHFMVINRPSQTNYVFLIDNSPTQVNCRAGSNLFDIQSDMYLGGVPEDSYSNLPSNVQSDSGFMGCLASIDLGGQIPDPIPDAKQIFGPVVSGCGDVFHPVTFLGPPAFAALPSLDLGDPSNMGISFAFKTKVKNGLLLYNGGRNGNTDFIALELVNGLLHYAFNTENTPSLYTANIRNLDDNNWHFVKLSSQGSGNVHYLKVDDQITQIFGQPRFDLGGRLYLGGVPEDTFKDLPSLLSSKASKRGYMGCMSSVDLNGRLPNLMLDSLVKRNDVQKGCTDALTVCHPELCQNGGICVSTGFDSYYCDCNMTSYVGKTCKTEANGFRYGFDNGEGPGIIVHDLRPPSNYDIDKLAFGFMTWYPTGTLIRVESSKNKGEYIIAKLDNGKIVLEYNVDGTVHRLVEGRKRFDDGNYHVVRFVRTNNNATLHVDSHIPNVFTHSSTAKRRFDRVSLMKVGGNKDADGNIIDYFNGIIAGVYYNGYRVLDKAVAGETLMSGDIRQAAHLFHLPKPTPPVGPVGGVGPGVGGAGVGWKSSPDGTVIEVGLHPSGGGGGGMVGAGVGPVVGAAVAGAGGATGAGWIGPRAWVAAGVICGILLIASTLIWAFYKCKPGWCLCGKAGGAAGGAGGAMSISGPKAAGAGAGYSLIKAEANGGAGSGAGAGAGAGASAGAGAGVGVKGGAMASNGTIISGGGGTATTSFNQYFTSMNSTSAVTGGAGAGAAAGAGAGRAAAISMYDGGSGANATETTALMSDTSNLNSSSFETSSSVVDGRAAGYSDAQSTLLVGGGGSPGMVAGGAGYGGGLATTTTTVEETTTTNIIGGGGYNAGGYNTMGASYAPSVSDSLVSSNLSNVDTRAATMDNRLNQQSNNYLSSSYNASYESQNIQNNSYAANTGTMASGVGTMSRTELLGFPVTHIPVTIPMWAEGEGLKVDTFKITASGNTVVTGSSVGPPQVFDMRNGELVRIMKGDDELGSTDLHLGCQDTLLVGQVESDGIIADSKVPARRLQIWDFETGLPMQMPTDEFCSATCLMSDGERMVFGRTEQFGKSTVIKVWDLLGNEPLKEMRYDDSIGFADSISYLALSRDDRYAIAGFNNTFDGNANFVVFDLDLEHYQVIEPKILALAADPQCTAVIGNHEAVTGTKIGELVVWSLKTGKPLRQLSPCGPGTLMRGSTAISEAHTREVKAVCASVDGRYLASASSDGTIKVWDLRREKQINTLVGHQDEVWCTTISADNEIIVSGSQDGSIRLWRLKTGKEICNYHAAVDVFSVKISNDNKTIVALGDKYSQRKLIMLQVVHSRQEKHRLVSK